MSSNPIKRDFSKNQIKILKLLFEKEYLQNELQKALNTTAPNLHYHLSRLEGYNLIIKETLHEVGSAKINKITLNPSTREYVQKLLGGKSKKSKHSNPSTNTRSSNKNHNRALKISKDNLFRVSLVIFVLSLAGVITLNIFLSIRVPAPINLTANGDIFTQVSQTGFTSIENVELTADADVFTQKTNISNINVYDGSGATPFLRLGLYEFTYDSGGYLSEIYVRFNLPKIENISSMLLQLTYWSGYPVETDSYYGVNATLVSNAWVEADTIWTERPGYLGTSSLVYLHNPSLEDEVYLNITSLVEGITETMITIHLCPNNLSRIRFPAPFESSESYGITPRLILEYKKTPELSINVYDNNGPTPFLRLGLYNSTYEMGGYLSEIYVRFNLPNVKNIRSMVLQLTYWEGYPIETDNSYEINASLVRSNWLEETTVWTERPEYLGTSTLVYLHNPNLMSEIYLDLTNLVEGMTEPLITIRLCPSNLSRIRFPAPFESSESYGVTPCLILDYSTRSESIIPDKLNQVMLGLLVLLGIHCFIALTGIIYRPLKHKYRKNRVDVMQERILHTAKQENQTPIITNGISEHVKQLDELKEKQKLCPHCGTTNFKGWKFCTTCGKHMKPKKESINTSEFLGGL